MPSAPTLDWRAFAIERREDPLDKFIVMAVVAEVAGVAAAAMEGTPDGLDEEFGQTRASVFC